jgi:hypothetical protein
MTKVHPRLQESASDALAVFRWFKDEIGENDDVAAWLTIAAILDLHAESLEPLIVELVKEGKK